MRGGRRRAVGAYRNAHEMGRSATPRVISSFAAGHFEEVMVYAPSDVRRCSCDVHVGHETHELKTKSPVHHRMSGSFAIDSLYYDANPKSHQNSWQQNGILRNSINQSRSSTSLYRQISYLSGGYPQIKMDKKIKPLVFLP